MRKGYLLVEMIVVLFILALIAATLERFWGTFVYELPRNSRLVQERRILNSAVNCIRTDVVSAKTLSVTDSNLLTIETPDGVVSYEFSDGRIIRSSPDEASGGIVWSVPNSRIDWQVRSRDKNGYAVEVCTYIEDRRLGHIRKKMANSFLFFTGTGLEGVE
jgi:type II secretory pathway pseudopilin PulG